MRMMKRAAFLGVLLWGGAVGAAYAGVNTWTNLGPEGGTILALAIDPQTPSTLYVGTNGGVFKSTDGGVNWGPANSGLPGSPIQALAVDPQTPSTLYAGSRFSGVLKSTDGGGNWSAVNTDLTDFNVLALAIDPQTPFTLYAGTDGGGVFKTTDGGGNWGPGVTIGKADIVRVIAIDPQTPSTLYAYFESAPGLLGAIAGIFKSTDGGANWSPASSGLLGLPAQGLAIDPQTPSTLYAGTQVHGVFKSTDGGSSWSAVNTDLTDFNVLALAIDPQTPSTLYAGLAGGLHVQKSVDGGATWITRIPIGGSPLATVVRALAVDPETPTTVYAGTTNGGVFKSNAFFSWSAVNTGLTALDVRTVAVDPITPSILYAGTDGGMFKTTNGGSSWSAVNTGLTNLDIRALVLGSQIPSTLYVGFEGLGFLGFPFGGVFKSTDGGANWGSASSGLPGSPVRVLVVDPQTPATLYAGTTGDGVFKSTDEGTSWSATGLTVGEISALALDPQTPSIVYAGFGGLFGGLEKSLDGGATWFSVCSFRVPCPIVRALAVDPQTPATLYVGTGGAVFKSTNGGFNWSSASSGLPGFRVQTLAIDPQTPSTLYVGTNGGVFKSTDGGANWSELNSGLTTLFVNALGIDPAAPTTLYAATTEGVFGLVQSADTTPPTITCPGHIAVTTDPGQAGAIVNYPLPVATDDAPGVIVTSSPPSGSAFPIGTTTVTATATDVSGNTATCSFTVTVVDNEPPTITAPADITTNTSPGQCSAMVNFAFTATDNSDIVAVTSSPVSGSTFARGATTVTGTASDPSGNTTSASFTVTVVDTEPPTITAPAPVTVGTGPDSTTAGAVVSDATLGIASANDNCADVSIARTGVPAGNLFPVGATTVTYTATDASGNAASATQTVTVIDTTPPAVTVPEGIIAEATGPAGAIVTYSASANDNVAGTLTPTCTPASGSTFPLGATAVTCTATDAAGNTGSGTFNVTVRDSTPPETFIVSAVGGDGNPVADGSFTTSSGITFAFQGTDIVGIADFRCLLDGGPAEVCASPRSYTGLPVGSHSFVVQAVDTSGNVDEMPPTFSWSNVAIMTPEGIEGTVTTDEEGNTVVTGTDATGETVVEITLPPGTEIPSGAMDVQVTTRGANSAAEVTGVSVPYPPGKSITIRSNPGANFACIVDRRDSVLAAGLPNCGSTDTSISQVRLECDGVARTFTGFPDAPTERVYTCIVSTEAGKTFMQVDGLAFSFILDYDACPALPGPVERQGCPVAGENQVELHVVDQAKSGACPDGAGSCKFPVAAAEVRVFDRNRLNGLSITTLDSTMVTLTKNPDGSLYDDIYESAEANTNALAASLGCVTDANGFCVAGEATPGDYLVIVKVVVDAGSGKTVYTGKPTSPADFADTDDDGVGDLASKEFQIVEVIKRDGTVQFSGGSKTVVTGSYLEIVYLDYAPWEDAAAGYVYPFIFTSDSAWEVDVCAQMPAGYRITGAYDENGTLVSSATCVQSFVSGQTKVIAFEVVEVGSPEPRLEARLRVRRSNGKETALDIIVPGMRMYRGKAGVDESPLPSDRP